MHYSLLTAGGDEKPMRLIHNDDAEDNLENQELFYTLTPETELLTVECCHDLTKKNRKSLKVEQVYKTYNKINTTNRRAYTVPMSMP